jgi:hypothetical protein
MFERVSLPKPPSVRFGVIEAGVLLRACDELLAVGRVGLSFHQEVKVIRHEAVRSYRERIFGGSARDLREHKIDDRPRCEYRRAVVRAECQRISVKSEIAK